MIRFRDDQVYNQVARWVAQRRIHTIERYFASYPEQLKLAGMHDMLDEIYRSEEGLGVQRVCEEPEAEGEFDWEHGLRVLKTAGKITVGVGGAYLIWRVSRRWRRHR